ncbi:MAG TPA: hypothetical protein VGM31_14220 [Puia sp.]|jgi:hypothetical protein
MKKLLLILLLFPCLAHAQLVEHAGMNWTSSTPTLTATPTTITGTSVAGSSGASVFYDISAAVLGSNSVVSTAITGWELSKDNTTFAGTQTMTPTGGVVTQRIYARLKSSNTAASYNGTITNTVTALSLTAPVTANGTTSAAPSLSATPSSITALNGTTGTAGTAQTATVTYVGTTVSAAFPTNTEISQNAGSTYTASSPQTITGASPLALKIRTTAAAPATAISGNLVLSGSGVTTVTIPVSGTVSDATLPSAIFNFSKTASTVTGAKNVFGDPTASPSFTEATTGWILAVRGAGWMKFGGTEYGGVGNGATVASSDGTFTQTQIGSCLYNIADYSSAQCQLEFTNLAAGTYAITLLGSIPTSVFDNTGNCEFDVVFGTGSNNQKVYDPNGKPASTGNITPAGPGTVTTGSFTGTITSGQTIKIWVMKGTGGANVGALGYINALKIVKTN